MTSELIQGPYVAEKIIASIGSKRGEAWSVFKKRPEDVQTVQQWVEGWNVKYPAFPGEEKMSQSHAERAARLMNAEVSELNQLRNQVQILQQCRELLDQLDQYGTAAMKQDPENPIRDLVNFVDKARDLIRADKGAPIINIAQLITYYKAGLAVLQRAYGSSLSKREDSSSHVCLVCGAIFEEGKGKHADECWMQDAAMLITIGEGLLR